LQRLTAFMNNVVLQPYGYDLNIDFYFAGGAVEYQR
jgi:hypothetical protein